MWDNTCTGTAIIKNPQLGKKVFDSPESFLQNMIFTSRVSIKKHVHYNDIAVHAQARNRTSSESESYRLSHCHSIPANRKSFWWIWRDSNPHLSHPECDASANWATYPINQEQHICRSLCLQSNCTCTQLTCMDHSIHSQSSWVFFPSHWSIGHM